MLASHGSALHRHKCKCKVVQRHSGRGERKFLTSVMQAHNACIMSYRCMHRDRAVEYPDTAFSPLDEPCFRPASFRPYSIVAWLDRRDRRPLRKSSTRKWSPEICAETINGFRYLDTIAASRVCSCYQVLRGARHAVAT